MNLTPVWNGPTIDYGLLRLVIAKQRKLSLSEEIPGAEFEVIPKANHAHTTLRVLDFICSEWCPSDMSKEELTRALLKNPRSCFKVRICHLKCIPKDL